MHTRLVYVDGAYCYMLQCYNVTKNVSFRVCKPVVHSWQTP